MQGSKTEGKKRTRRNTVSGVIELMTVVAGIRWKRSWAMLKCCLWPWVSIWELGHHMVLGMMGLWASPCECQQVGQCLGGTWSPSTELHLGRWCSWAWLSQGGGQLVLSKHVLGYGCCSIPGPPEIGKSVAVQAWALQFGSLWRT